ncbi:hypothetical protein AB0M12_34200 [Nocardia vinacea]|uniref:hypothetical protein n=1 Tax=Nocardia vinacea TaxID=96468 RepID=UPI0034164593
MIGELVGLLTIGGLISILTPNPSCDPLAAAVRRSDLDEALRLMNTTQRESATYGMEYASRTADEVVGYVLGAGMNPPLRYGVRAVCDLIADDEAKPSTTPRSSTSCCGWRTLWPTAAHTWTALGSSI